MKIERRQHRTPDVTTFCPHRPNAPTNATAALAHRHATTHPRYTTAVKKIDYQLTQLKKHEHQKGQQLAKESSEAHLRLGDAHQNMKRAMKVSG